MTPKRNTEIDPYAEGYFEPFPTPNTIPAGWSVAGFFEPEQKYEYRPSMYGPIPPRASLSHESAEASR